MNIEEQSKFVHWEMVFREINELNKNIIAGFCEYDVNVHRIHR